MQKLHEQLCLKCDLLTTRPAVLNARSLGTLVAGIDTRQQLVCDGRVAQCPAAQRLPSPDSAYQQRPTTAVTVGLCGGRVLLPPPATVYCYTELTAGSHPSRRPAHSQYYAVASLALAGGRHTTDTVYNCCICCSWYRGREAVLLTQDA